MPRDDERHGAEPDPPPTQQHQRHRVGGHHREDAADVGAPHRRDVDHEHEREQRGRNSEAATPAEAVREETRREQHAAALYAA